MLDTIHRVRDLAYRLWEEHGRPIGRDEENWFEAERLLNGECDVEGSREGITKMEKKGQQKNSQTRRKSKS